MLSLGYYISIEFSKGMIQKLLIVSTLLVTTPPLFAQTSFWNKISSVPQQAGTQYIRPDRSVLYTADFNGLKTQLQQAPAENTGHGMSMAIPTPDGNFETFEIWRYDMMQPGLQAQYPELGTYLGRSSSNPSRVIRLDHTLQGFHAMVLGTGGSWYIDPVAHLNTQYYQVYYKTDLKNTKEFSCGTADPILTDDPVFMPKNLFPNGTLLKTYRLALAATGEYTAFHGGQANAVSAQVTSMNRVNGVYEIELAVRMVLIGNNNLLVYTNANSDPYTNNDGGTMLGQNKTTINNVIGSANYDIGHVFSTGGGGIAQLGCVCTSDKAEGVTGSSAPVGDPFDIDYVAHEMGHQFGANHTFNSTIGSCGGGNRSGSNAYEPGSGITIMAYAGICGADDLAPNSIDNFHVGSYNAIRSFITTGSGNGCDVASNTNNSIPTVEAGPSIYRIPLSTPFRLTAVGNDADAGDELTYSWEQYDLGNNVALTANPTTGTHPLFRPFSPDTSPTRVFPRMQTIVNNQTDNKEKLPYYARRLRFRVMVRDNRPNGGGTSLDSNSIWSVANTGPFLVTSPNTFLTWSSGSSQTVTWNTAGSNQAPINCQNVNIKLSTDGGYTYPITLLANTPNDGSQAITVPTLGQPTVSTCRVMVEAADNIFFDISNTNFTIQNAPLQAPVANFATTSPTTLCAGQSLTFFDESTNGPSQWTWQFPGGTPSSSTTQNPAGIVFSTPGTYTVSLTVQNAAGSSSSEQTVTVNALPTATFSVVPAAAGQTNGSASITPAGGPAPYQVQWATNPVQNGNTASNLGAGAYVVTVTNAGGCMSVFSVTVPGNASVEEVDALGSLFYPNPASEEITLRLNAEGKYSYTWYDAAGRTVQQGNFTGNTYTFALGAFANGIYTFRISDGTHTAVKKVVKQH